MKSDLWRGRGRREFSAFITVSKGASFQCLRKDRKNLSNQGCGRDAYSLTLSEKSRPREWTERRRGQCREGWWGFEENSKLWEDGTKSPLKTANLLKRRPPLTCWSCLVNIQTSFLFEENFIVGGRLGWLSHPLPARAWHMTSARLVRSSCRTSNP